MKKIILVLMAIMLYFAVKAQDKIITIQNDTIECRIISVNADRITYEQKTQNNQVAGKSIATTEVLQYLRSEINDLLNPDIHNKLISKPEHRFLLTIQSGLSYSFTDLTNFKNLLTNAGVAATDADDYTDKLKNGIHINAGFHYLLNNWIGIGADYTFFQSSSEGVFLVNGYSGMNFPVYTTTQLDEKIYSNFFGLSALFQQFPGIKHKIRLCETISPGVVFFRDETRGIEYQEFWPVDDIYYGQLPQYYNNSNTLTQGKSFGLKGGLSVEYLITSRLSAGISGSFLWANLQKVSIKGLNYDSGSQELEKAIDISHIDYGFSLRYSF
jgi:hypothetical protein